MSDINLSIIKKIKFCQTFRYILLQVHRRYIENQLRVSLLIQAFDTLFLSGLAYPNCQSSIIILNIYEC